VGEFEIDILTKAHGRPPVGMLARNLPTINAPTEKNTMIKKLKSGGYRLYSRKKNPKTGKRRNLGTFKTLSAAKQHERDIQFFKRHG
jgi:hypothetical protein